MPESVNSKPVRVLIVDDEEDDFILTSSQIKDITTRTFAIEWCSNYKKLLNASESQSMISTSLITAWVQKQD